MLGYDLKIACAEFQGYCFIIDGEIDMFIASTCPGAVVKAGSNPYLPFKYQRNKMFLPRSLVNMQY